jgi:hypothetical protein
MQTLVRSVLGSWLLVGAALFTSEAALAAEPGDAQAKKLIKQAMEKNYVAKDYSGAVRKLGQGATLCEQKGCTPSVHAHIYASLAVVHWNGTEDYDSAVEALRTMVRLEPEHSLDRRLATSELKDALDTARVDVQVEATQPATPAAEAAPAPPPPDPDEGLDPAEAKERAFRRQVEARKAQYAREQEDAQKKADQEAARYAAEQKKAEAQRKAEEARKAQEEKRDAARKAAEEKKETARRAQEAKAADEARRVEMARISAQEKKAAAIRAAEDKKAEDARKAEEAKRAKEEERLRTPIKAGKLIEEPWAAQTMGFPLPVFVKLPPPPAGIERERTDVAKVVTEYYGPGTPIPQKFELKPMGGGYGGYLPCDATSVEGVVTYFTIALNKYDNLVAIGASPQKPNKVTVRPTMGGQFPHLPGELPPKSCAEGGGGPIAQAETPDGGAGCAADTDCPDGGVCAQKVCASPKPAPPVPSTKPRWRACFGCEIGAQGDTAPWGVIVALALLAVRIAKPKRSF